MPLIGEHQPTLFQPWLLFSGFWEISFLRFDLHTKVPASINPQLMSLRAHTTRSTFNEIWKKFNGEKRRAISFYSLSWRAHILRYHYQAKLTDTCNASPHSCIVFSLRVSFSAVRTFQFLRFLVSFVELLRFVLAAGSDERENCFCRNRGLKRCISSRNFQLKLNLWLVNLFLPLFSICIWPI